MPTEETFFNSPSAIKSIADLKVKNKEKVQELMGLYKVALSQSPNGSKLLSNWTGTVSLIIDPFNIPKPHDPKIVALFQKMKEFALANKLNDLANAITSSAAWYYYNVEKPKSPSSSIAQYGTDENNPIVKDQKKKKTKSQIIKYGMIGGSVLVGLSLLYFAFKPQGAKSNPSPRPKRRKKPKFVTKGRVRKRNRKKPVQSKSKPKIAYTSSGGNLKAYRNNFEKRKRKNKVK